MRDHDDVPYIVIERESGSFGAFVLGALVGAGLALLFAPQSGEQTQQELKDRARKLKESAEERVRDAQRQLEERLETARHGIQHRVDAVREAVDSGRTAAREARGDLERKLERSKTAYRAGLEAARDLGVDVLGLQGYLVTLVQHAFVRSVAFVSIWVLFLGIYRYLPARRIPWRTALIAATFAAALHELLKFAFGWYATELANYRTTYGNLITLAVLFFWIYYEALVFILAGELAQVWTMRRALRVRTRGALFGVRADPGS